MNSEERADQLITYLRGLGNTLDDHMILDAADMIEEQMATIFVAYEKISEYEAPRKRKSAKPELTPGMNPQLRALVERTGKMPPMRTAIIKKT